MHSKYDDGKSGDDNQCDLVLNDDGVALGSFFGIWLFFLIMFMDPILDFFEKWTSFTVGQFIHLEPEILANYVLINYIVVVFLRDSAL